MSVTVFSSPAMKFARILKAGPPFSVSTTSGHVLLSPSQATLHSSLKWLLKLWRKLWTFWRNLNGAIVMNSQMAFSPGWGVIIAQGFLHLWSGKQPLSELEIANFMVNEQTVNVHSHMLPRRDAINTLIRTSPDWWGIQNPPKQKYSHSRTYELKLKREKKRL